MGSGVSIWWATPAEPDRHFADDELTESDRYHRRTHRAGFVAMTAKVGLLLLAAVLAGRSADHRGAAQSWADDVGWLTSVISGRVIAGAALTAIALRAPAVAVDAWFEFRFRHGRDDHQPVPLHWFGAATVALTAAITVALMIVVGTIYRLAVNTDRWPFIAMGVVVVLMAAFAIGERWLRKLGGDSEKPIDDHDLLVRLDRLASRFDLSGLRFATSTASAASTASAISTASAASTSTASPSASSDLSTGAVAGPSSDTEVPNAYSVGLGPNRRVVMTEALLREPDAIGDFVVAHELTHVSKRHVLIQTAAAIVAALLVIATVAVAAATESPWDWFGFEPTDPLGLPVTALVILLAIGVLGPASGWLSRAQERAADAGAVAVVGVPPADEAKRLYVATTADLRPPWWARLYAPHPAPAERLEFLARQRRVAAPGPTSELETR